MGSQCSFLCLWIWFISAAMKEGCSPFFQSPISMVASLNWILSKPAHSTWFLRWRPSKKQGRRIFRCLKNWNKKVRKHINNYVKDGSILRNTTIRADWIHTGLKHLDKATGAESWHTERTLYQKLIRSRVPSASSSIASGSWSTISLICSMSVTGIVAEISIPTASRPGRSNNASSSQSPVPHPRSAEQINPWRKRLTYQHWQLEYYLVQKSFGFQQNSVWRSPWV